MPYFTEAELRALPQMADTTKYTSAAVTSATAWIESIIERKVGTSFVVRSTVETHDGYTVNNRAARLTLRKPYVQAITAITSNGVAFTAPQLAQVTLRDGIVELRSSFFADLLWDFGIRNIVVTYDAGYSTTPPADIKEAALTAARDFLLRRYAQQGTSDRTVSLSTEMGNVTYATANDLYRPTGIPDVDAVIMGWASRLDNFGFA